ncbi:hypothetical protein FM106_23700 [Brachybacterium faecium]|nr:hypothetical protein FM106_23700 [Brachybacterium faecium]
MRRPGVPEGDRRAQEAVAAGSLLEEPVLAGAVVLEDVSAEPDVLEVPPESSEAEPAEEPGVEVEAPEVAESVE